MKRYRTLDFKIVQKYIRTHKLHLRLKNNALTHRIQNLHKLNHQLQVNDDKINIFLMHYFEHNLKILPHLLTLPMSYPQALLIGIYGYVPELRHRYHVNGYCSSTEHYYFVFHQANLHSKRYWTQLKEDILNATQIPIYYETLIKHDLKPYLQNFRDMCYSNRAITKLCLINCIKRNNVHKFVYTKHNQIRELKINNKDLLMSHKIRVNRNNSIAVYNIKGHYVLIKSKALIKDTH